MAIIVIARLGLVGKLCPNLPNSGLDLAEANGNDGREPSFGGESRASSYRPRSISALPGPVKTNPLPAHIFPGNRKYSPDPAYYGY